MLISIIILGWIGVFICLTIILTFQRMIKNNEFGFLHILMALMYAMWFPLPWALNQILDSDVLQVGTIFGFAYLLMLVMTMTLQTGHITYFVKHNEGKSSTDQQGAYMMATLSNPFEGLANVFKGIWAVFLGIAFWTNGEAFMASLMFAFSLFFFYYLLIVLNASLVRSIKLFSWAKPNPLIVNVETFLFFIVLVSYLTFTFKTFTDIAW